VATAIVIAIIVLVAAGAIYVWTLSRRRGARSEAGSLPLAGRDRETLQGDRADGQAATEAAARRRRQAG
jgi:hypothetical protein